MEGVFENAFEGLQVHLQIPDLWQQEAIRALSKGLDVIVAAPTGAGKTFVFESLVDAGKLKGQAIYTVPTRALANDKWREWKARGWDVGIATGDIAENLDAGVIVATLETQKERLITGQGPSILVIDEYQMIADRQRGMHYELAISLAPPDTQLLLLSGSVRNPSKVAQWMKRIGRTVKVVETKERPVPLDELPYEALPNQAPNHIKFFQARLAIGTLLSNFGPLLIFTPHRRSSEKLAKKIAEALPDDQPIEFKDPKLAQLCSKETTRLLRKRVAIHHSGIGFAERSAIIEPLAKAGQLRVIVATMGLAAGINFSVRSVFIADRTYQDGPYQRDVSPDELLQMFGRAGRRGLDTAGYVVFGNKSPRLVDSYPLDIRRANEIDWPTLLRKMEIAANKGEDPFEAARDLVRRLFSKQRIVLGFKNKVTDSSMTEVDGLQSDGQALFGLKATRKEVCNFNGEWEDVAPGREHEKRLEQTYTFVKGRYRPTESSSSYISSWIEGRGRLTRLDNRKNDNRRYGVEIIIAQQIPHQDGAFRLTKFIQKKTRTAKDTILNLVEIKQWLPELLIDEIKPAKYFDIVQRGQSVYLQGHFAHQKVLAYQDATEHWLFQPRQRTREVESATSYVDQKTGEEFTPGVGTPAHSWRKLGLIDDHGRPTSRGVICGFFQHGEGLAVAAALEDPTYDIEEMIYHFANLRAGYRFEISERGFEGGSERLATACRQAYGPVDFEGYLQLGLPTGYGEGAAEVVQLWLEGKGHTLFSKGSTLEFGPGDIERAYIEWLSFMRHVKGAPDALVPRWKELKYCAASLLKKHDRSSPLQNLPTVPTTILQKPPQNRISYSKIR